LCEVVEVGWYRDVERPTQYYNRTQ
jgi:hypothetical protein